MHTAGRTLASFGMLEPSPAQGSELPPAGSVLSGAAALPGHRPAVRTGPPRGPAPGGGGVGERISEYCEECFQRDFSAEPEGARGVGGAVDEGLREAYALRARLRGLAVAQSVRACGTRVYTRTPAVLVGFGRQTQVWWEGVVSCGSVYACPVCARRAAIKRAAEIEAAIRADAWVWGGTWQMVTLSLSHHSCDRLSDLIELLLAAWRRVRATRRVRDIMHRRVSASVRQLEVMWSARNGWHPHLHLLWRTESWTARERQILAEEWARAVDGRANEHAVRWSDARPAEPGANGWYVAGTELTGLGARSWTDADGWEHMPPGAIARLAAVGGDLRADRLWREYQSALLGRQMIALDSRAKALARLGRKEDPERPAVVVDVPIEPQLVSRLARRELDHCPALYDFLSDVREGADEYIAEGPAAAAARAVQDAIDGWLGMRQSATAEECHGTEVE